MKATRVFQLTALVLVIVSVVQVGWWLFDQYDYTTEKVQVARRLHAREVAAAQALLDSGVSSDRVRELVPEVSVEGGKASLIKAASERGWIDERAAAFETLTGIKRAGADLIITYYAPDAAQWLRE
ncbi:MAG: hypothetical protein ACRET3_06020 [Burkholderiales bacterium]